MDQAKASLAIQLVGGAFLHPYNSDLEINETRMSCFFHFYNMKLSV